MTIAMCPLCERLMDGSGCVEGDAWPWGSEPNLGPVDWPCHDCGVLPGGNHHAGCCVAHCRTCGEQLLGCIEAEPVN